MGCQTCDNDPSNDCQQDCANMWGGDADLDECGTCDADNSNDCQQDCADVWGGDAQSDECGTCDNDASNDCQQDCAGTWGGDEDCDDDCELQDVDVDGEEGWYDSDGPNYDCAWYDRGSRCQRYGDSYENFGYTANEACVACGGGE